MNPLKNGDTYFLKFEVKDAEAAAKFFAENGIFPFAEKDLERTGIETKEVSWVDWRKKVQEIQEFMSKVPWA